MPADLSKSPRLLSRRHVLQVGGLGLAGLSLPRLLAARASAAESGVVPKADRCVVIFLNGGPSHLDMWDMKPDAPAGIRGEFQAIETSLPGYRISEHLPLLAKHMHRAAVVRSMHHSVNNAHAAAVYTALTGHDRGDNSTPSGATGADYPSLGSVVSLKRPPQGMALPHVCLPYITKEGAGGPPQPGFFGGFLGGACDPLFVLRDPNSADFSVPELTLAGEVTSQRLAGRKSLFASVDERYRSGLGPSPLEAMDGFQHRALDLLTAAETQRAFRISEEPAAVRDAYGRNIYGQSVLLARRLLEAGTRLATISWAPDANATWDTHGGNFKKLKSTLLPQFDAACGSLLTDLTDRGMLDRTLVAVFGDFGRTPKINANDGGRDHWNHCYSLMLVGGGIKNGIVRGASDATGAFPSRDPHTPAEIIATMYELLGVPPRTEIYDRFSRPHRLVPGGDPVAELMA